MSEFVKPTRVELDVTTALKLLLGETVILVKDLQSNQQICANCHGLGIQKNDFRYGLRCDGDPELHESRFPYHEQSVGPCPCCFVGVQTLCEHCKQPWPKAVSRCECKADADARRAEADAKEEERKKRCKRIAFKDYKGECMYDDDAEAFIYDGADEDLDHTHTYYACDATKHWVGFETSDLLDRIKERAEEECEDGADMVDWDPAAEAKLEEFLKAWFAEHVKVSETYWADRGTIVVVTPEDCGVTEDEDGNEIVYCGGGCGDTMKVEEGTSVVYVCASCLAKQLGGAAHGR